MSSVIGENLVIYTAQNMPENNTSLVGGDINSGVRASFNDPSSAAQVVIYSSSIADTSQTLTLAGRIAGGMIVSEAMSLNGIDHVTTDNTYERILNASVNAIGAGIITVSGKLVNKIADIPIGENGFNRPFYDARTSSTTSKTYYEKVFAQNSNSVASLNNAHIIEVSSGLYANISFALEDSKQSDQTISNRESVPTGVTGGFGAGPTSVIGTSLTAGDYQGIWLKLSLNAGETAQNSFYEVQISGTTA